GKIQGFLQVPDLHRALRPLVQKLHQLLVNLVDALAPARHIAHAGSTSVPAWSPRTNSSIAAGPAWENRSSIACTTALPTTAASACAWTSRTCAAVEMPNPTASGREVTRRARSTNGRTLDAISLRSPVTPVREIRYKKPVESCAARFRRASVEVGEARNTVSRFCARIA